MGSSFMRGVLLTALLAAGGGGCGAQSAGSSPMPFNRDLITAQEIAGVEVRTTALQLIQRMRPTWLQGRGPSGIRTGAASVMIYVNNQRMSDSPLTRYTAGELVEIRYLNAADATQRFGTGHGSGAILIMTR